MFAQAVMYVMYVCERVCSYDEIMHGSSSSIPQKISMLPDVLSRLEHDADVKQWLAAADQARSQLDALQPYSVDCTADTM
ncbi:hypothetical protein D2E26_0660 [Bifidobacterium dolichotidis]|uniref:Uncharacterized protein n=1 Tax=Bifidobacterium dolichotidis TaxID=2306976 RepID=A0A430FTE3_9BIFI|nr:hypothetical protein D2E26_0660 [Bifidobacterium dolichotidis]